MLVQNGLVEEVLESDHTVPAAVAHTARNCKSTKVKVKYSCDQKARILDVLVVSTIVCSGRSHGV